MSSAALIGVNVGDLQAIASAIRCNVIHADILAKQIDELIAHAKPAVDALVAMQLYRALLTNGSHTCGVHLVRHCAMCDAIAAYIPHLPVEKKPGS